MKSSSTQRRPYADREEAGDVLAAELAGYLGRPDVLILGLPRGGVPVAARVAAALGAPLDALAVRKLGLPFHRELAMGAIAAIGSVVEVVRNDRVIDRVGIGEADFQRVLERETDELLRRERNYRGDRVPPQLRGRTVIVVDDGLATGSTMRAAVATLRRAEPARIVVAVPIAAADTCSDLSEQADDVVCPWTPTGFFAVGQGYADFSPTTDDEVRQLLG